MIDKTLLSRFLWFLSLVGLSINLFPAETLGQPTVRAPLLLAIHEDVKSKLDGEDIERLQLSLSTDGILLGPTARVVATACRPPMSSFVYFWNDDDLVQYANLQSTLSDTTKARIAQIHAGNKRLLALEKQGKRGLVVSLENAWSFYASDAEIVSLVKAAVLRKAGLAAANAPFPDLSRTMLPVVIIMLPTPGLFGKDDDLSDSVIVTSILRGTTNGWTLGGGINALSTTLGKRYIVLANESLVSLPWMNRSLFTFTMSHEVGHYFGLPHTYVDAEDLKYNFGPAGDSSLVRKAAKRIAETPDCAKSEQYSQGRILDVDYGKQRIGDSQRIGDTVPVMSGSSSVTTACLNAYAAEIQAGMLDPKKSLMGRPANNPENPQNYEREGPDLKITLNQMSVVTQTIADMREKPSPLNLCGN